MKKRLLITSIVMMLVVAVSLGTATYAWFTSNASVTASSVTLTAATNASKALGIGWAGGDAGTAISHEVTGTLDPMAPTVLAVDSTSSAGTASTAFTFIKATTKQEGSVIVFNGDKTTDGVNPKFFDDGNSVNAFYIKNLSPSNSISKVTVTAVWGYQATSDVSLVNGKTYYTLSEGVYEPVASPDVSDIASYYEEKEANDMIRVAIFTKDASQGAGAGNYTLLGILGNKATVGTAVGERAFDRNTPYFTRSGSEGAYVYTQDKTITAADFDDASKKATLYTCENTVAWGDENLFDQGDAVKDLNYFTNVKTSLDIVTNRANGTFNLDAGYQVDIVAIVWLDGTKLSDDRQGDVGTVSLSFSA